MGSLQAGKPSEEKQEFPGCSILVPLPIALAHVERSGPEMLTISKRPVYVIGQGRCIMRGKRYSSHVASCSFPGREPVPRRYIHVCPYGSESAGSSLKGRHESALWILKPAVYGHAA